MREILWALFVGLTAMTAIILVGVSLLWWILNHGSWDDPHPRRRRTKEEE